MALGATGGQVLQLFLRQALLAALCGITLGTTIALALTRWLETLLFGVTATDATTFAIVIAVLLSVAAAACYVPARRAAQVDPLIALRWELLLPGADEERVPVAMTAALGVAAAAKRPLQRPDGAEPGGIEMPPLRQVA